MTRTAGPCDALIQRRKPRCGAPSSRSSPSIAGAGLPTRSLRSSGSSSAMMARGLGSTSFRPLCSHAASAVASWRVAYIAIRKASERPGSGAILDCHGLVSGQLLPLGDDDDALGLLRQQL